MPFVLVHFLVRLFHAVIFFLCLVTWNYSEASFGGASSTVLGPATPDALRAKPGTSVLSFSEWRQERLNQAQKRIDSLQDRLNQKNSNIEALRTKGALGSVRKDRTTEVLTETLKIEKENYEFAQRLTLSDYLMGYLAQQKNRKAAIEAAAAQMSPQDVVELIELFAQKSARPQTRSSMVVGEALGGLEF